jgi:hypothetical protein
MSNFVGFASGLARDSPMVAFVSDFSTQPGRPLKSTRSSTTSSKDKKNKTEESTIYNRITISANRQAVILNPAPREGKVNEERSAVWALGCMADLRATMNMTAYSSTYVHTTQTRMAFSRTKGTRTRTYDGRQGVGRRGRAIRYLDNLVTGPGTGS